MRYFLFLKGGLLLAVAASTGIFAAPVVDLERRCSSSESSDDSDESSSFFPIHRVSDTNRAHVEGHGTVDFYSSGGDSDQLQSEHLYKRAAGDLGHHAVDSTINLVTPKGATTGKPEVKRRDSAPGSTSQSYNVKPSPEVRRQSLHGAVPPPGLNPHAQPFVPGAGGGMSHKPDLKFPSLHDQVPPSPPPVSHVPEFKFPSLHDPPSPSPGNSGHHQAPPIPQPGGNSGHHQVPPIPQPAVHAGPQSWPLGQGHGGPAGMPGQVPHLQPPFADHPGPLPPPVGQVGLPYGPLRGPPGQNYGGPPGIPGSVPNFQGPPPTRPFRVFRHSDLSQVDSDGRPLSGHRTGAHVPIPGSTDDTSDRYIRPPRLRNLPRLPSADDTPLQNLNQNPTASVQPPRFSTAQGDLQHTF